MIDFFSVSLYESGERDNIPKLAVVKDIAAGKLIGYSYRMVVYDRFNRRWKNTYSGDTEEVLYYAELTSVEEFINIVGKGSIK